MAKWQDPRNKKDASYPAAVTPEDPLFAPDRREDSPDLVSVHADDLLLSTLDAARQGDGRSLEDRELAALLLSWRAEVDAEPLAELVDIDTALATIAAAKSSRSRRFRVLIPLASAAAVLAITFTGVGIAAQFAQPGDGLWGLTRVLYSEHARSIEAAASVRAHLETATLALRKGNVAEAKAALAEAEAALGGVAKEDGKETLAQQHETLRDQVSLEPTQPPVSEPVATNSPGSEQPSPTAPTKPSEPNNSPTPLSPSPTGSSSNSETSTPTPSPTSTSEPSTGPNTSGSARSSDQDPIDTVPTSS